MSEARSAGRDEGRGAAYYRRLLREQEASGSSLRAFALERGLSPWTLYGWRSRLRRTRGFGAPTKAQGHERFVAVDVIEADEAVGAIEIALPGGMVVRLPRTISVSRLVELVRALRSC